MVTFQRIAVTIQKRKSEKISTEYFPECSLYIHNHHFEPENIPALLKSFGNIDAYGTIIIVQIWIYLTKRLIQNPRVLPRLDLNLISALNFQ